MHLSLLQYVLGMISGSFIGLSLGLIGGGGSILAVPLLVYLVGVKDPHLAIGTSAFAVAVNAASGLIGHARSGTVRWHSGGLYAIAGVAGALAGSTVGKLINGQHLLILFALLMILVAALMLRSREAGGTGNGSCTRETAPRLAGYGAGTGLLSGFFGIGGGFLIVPGLIASTGMPIVNAVGSSLIAVTTFGLTTALNYGVSDQVDWPLAFTLIAGGVVGSAAGCRLAAALAVRGSALKVTFSAIVMVVAVYVLLRGMDPAWLHLSSNHGAV